MSIEYHPDDETLEITCDSCDRRPEYHKGATFKAALAKAKMDGWRVFKDPTGVWCHKCPVCMAVERGPVDTRRRHRTDD